MAPRRQDPIKKVTLADGATRYRFVIDVGKKPDGSRDQRTFTFDTLKEAKAERAKIIAAKSAGTYVAPSKITVAEFCEQWLASKRNIRRGTRTTYRNNLAHAVERIGHLRMQQVTQADIDKMVDHMLSGGRRGTGNVQRQSLEPATVNRTLTVLQQAFDNALAQGIIGRNVVRLVERPSPNAYEMSTWTEHTAAAFLQSVSTHRLSAAWQLSLYGLRRSEVLGLRWSDLDLVAGTLTVNNARKMSDGVIYEEDPKTERSKRTLPLKSIPGLVDALVTLQLRQREEGDLAGEAYQPLCPLCGGHHVVTDELGQPYRPEWYGDQFERLARTAGLPVIRLHDARHTCGTLMHLRGVKVAVISAWLGHAKVSFTMDTYVHSQDEALTAAGGVIGAAYAGSGDDIVINRNSINPPR
ncbi:tyrosine-type recombinase/integrase [Dactylosporangium sp. CA-139066]|uniref:tyrosine-type recombinase/integrase n=1 Tax=Dactylosporangium sp. CA-139066 TaxID=3239930 RepID=UPI003D8A4257